jgi:hypothetical protein
MPTPHPRRWAALAVIALAQFMVIIDVQGAGAVLLPVTVTIMALVVLVAPGVIARFGAKAPAAFLGLGGRDRGACAPSTYGARRSSADRESRWSRFRRACRAGAQCVPARVEAALDAPGVVDERGVVAGLADGELAADRRRQAVVRRGLDEQRSGVLTQHFRALPTAGRCPGA